MTQLTKNNSLGKVEDYEKLSGKKIGEVGAAKHPVLSHEPHKYSAAFTTPDHHIAAANIHHARAVEFARAGNHTIAQHHQKIEAWHRAQAQKVSHGPQIGTGKKHESS